MSASLTAILIVVFSCSRSTEIEGPHELFVDSATSLGLDFVHNNGMTGEIYMVEMVGSGAALFDFDNDGDLDVFLVDGGQLGPRLTSATTALGNDRLFQNQLVEDGSLRFEDVSATALPERYSYGQGVATGDFDNDGWIDLYLTSYTDNRLLRNLGDGTFEDVTVKAGVGDSRWNTTAVFFDYDRDGYLDLFVGAYIDSTINNHYRCTAYSGIEDYCGPKTFPALSDRLFRNLGNGRFEDVSTTSGIAGLEGACLGAVSADFNGDGLVDLYVANDQMENYLWVNLGDGTFENRSRISGTSVNAEGMAEASMGVEVADLNSDGILDIFLTHLKNETNTLYSGRANGVFSDTTSMTQLGPSSLPFTSFGTRALDYDNDSDLDLLVANGSVRRIQEQLEAGDLLALSQPNQLFGNQGDGRFEELTTSAFSALQRLRVSRGVASGDIDNDGDIDALITNNNGPVELLINQLEPTGQWLGLDLRMDSQQARPALGAVVHLYFADGSQILRTVQTSGSFLSAHDPRVIFGLVGTAKPSRLVIEWPTGKVVVCSVPPQGRYTTLEPSSDTCHEL